MKEQEKVTISKAKLDLILEAFEAGCDDRQACIYAGVSLRDFARYQLENPTFEQQRMDVEAANEAYARVAILKKVKRASQDNTVDAKTDAEFAKWYLERTSEQFKPKSNQDITSGGKPLPTMINIIAPKGVELSTDDANT
jgi:hypothetical protein